MVAKKFPKGVRPNTKIRESPLYLLNYPCPLIDRIESREDEKELLIADSGMNLVMPKIGRPMLALLSAHVSP